MKRADAQKAIDEAFADGLKDLYTMLAKNELSEKAEDAVAQFERGVADFADAHTRASAVIDKIFPE